MIKSVPVLLILSVLSAIDMKKREVPHWGVTALFVYSLFASEDFTASLLWGFYAFLGLFFIYWSTEGGIGGGDVKLLAVLGFYLGQQFPVYLGFLSLTAGAGFLAGVVYYRRISFSLPLVPLMLAAFVLQCGFWLILQN